MLFLFNEMQISGGVFCKCISDLTSKSILDVGELTINVDEATWYVGELVVGGRIRNLYFFGPKKGTEEEAIFITFNYKNCDEILFTNIEKEYFDS